MGDVEEPGGVVAASEPDAGGGKRRKALKRGAGVGVGALALGVVFGFLLPRIASWSDVVSAAKEITWQGGVALALAAILNVVTFAPPWMAALPGLGFVRALTVTQASTAAASVIPGGEAVGVGLSVSMLRGWSFAGSAIALAAVVTTVWNATAKAVFPLVAIGLLAATGQASSAVTALAPFAVILLVALVGGGVAALASDRLAHRLGDLAGRCLTWLLRLVRRGPVVGLGDRIAHFRKGAIALLRRRWHVLTLATLAGHLSVFVVLLVALRALGVESDEVTVIEAFAAWALSRLLTLIPLTPGGLGFVELGLSGALVAFGGNDAEVVAAVMVYRLITWLPPILLGIPAGLLWKRMHPDRAGAA